jgi:hypothetical protein
MTALRVPPLFDSIDALDTCHAAQLNLVSRTFRLRIQGMNFTEKPRRFETLWFAVTAVLLVFAVGVLVFGKPTFNSWLNLAASIANFMTCALVRKGRSCIS